MPLNCFYPRIQFRQSFSRHMELIIVHSVKPPQTRSLLLLWNELHNFLVVGSTFLLNLLSFYLSTKKADPTSHHLSNHAEIHHFHFKALQKFLTCQQLACDTSTWLNILAFAVGMSNSSTLLVLCLYPCTIQTYCSRGGTSQPTPIKPQHHINPSTKQICIVKLF